MGKVIVPKYRVEYRDQAGWHDCIWRGRATNERAEDWRQSMNKSFQHDGVNYSASQAAGYIIHVSHVKVVRQRDRVVVAQATMPMFEVV